MKKYLLLTLLVFFSFFFAACNKSETDGDVKITGKGLDDFRTEQKENVIPQVGEPEEEVAFDNPISERATGVSEADVLEVREKLADGFGLDVADVQITAEGESSENYMTGYVNVGEGEKGGIYFAARTDNGWVIAHNGVGIVYCDSIEEHNFPVGMVPKCYDMNTGISKERE